MQRLNRTRTNGSRYEPIASIEHNVSLNPILQICREVSWSGCLQSVCPSVRPPFCLSVCLPVFDFQVLIERDSVHKCQSGSSCENTKISPPAGPESAGPVFR